ncbi:MAG: N-methyl-D-aspartate receptor NMDAR2C subunit [bacterium]|nr:N-methyl-D-aspartate receptor NMDAR2C subunit [bacterium]MCP5060171.1 N-methyl-D-aspartate receptor NMDAR2C subunit [bacterium]
MPTEEQVACARDRWNHLWLRFDVPAPVDGTLDKLLRSYGDHQRHYHTFAHVLDCLEVLDRFEHLATRPHEIEAAIWFHDVVYDTRRSNNEKASADWAASTLRACGAAADAVERVREIILATCHTGEPGTSDESLALDIDLSILGRDRGKFDMYQAQIRREFDWVPADAFRSARIKVLHSFLDRECIFRTNEMRTRYEDAARENLATALEELSATKD